jgi:cell division protein FtsQ
VRLRRRRTVPDEARPDDAAAQDGPVGDEEDTVPIELARRSPVAEVRDEPDEEAHEVDDEPDEQTVRVARKRFRRRQWSRRWLAWRRVLVAVLLVAVLAGAGWLVFFSPVLAVAGVQVEGTDVVSPGAVRRAAEVPTGTPLATVDLDSVTARVEGLVGVKRVDVSRSWPDKVRIAVTERKAVAVVEPTQAGGKLRGTDATGVVFRTFDTRPQGLPVIRTGDKTGSDALAEAATVAGSLPPDLAARVRYVEVRTVDTIQLVLRSGRTVRWGSADDSVNKARVLAVLLRQKATFYDVSVPGQPVIRK